MGDRGTHGVHDRAARERQALQEGEDERDLTERPIIRAADVRPMLRQHTVEAEGPTGPGFPRTRLLDILRRANWNTRRAAEQLGMHRATLYRHMQRFGIRVPAAALLDEPGRLESRVSGAAE